MNNTLYKAIFALDAYNRGYNAGINLENNTDAIGSQIGNAVVVNESDIEAGTPGVLSSFYAIAYTLNGEKTISYRGTDGFGDVTDFLGGAGVSGTQQADLAFKFFHSVAGLSGTDLTEANLKGANISLTGHSLGGGLAGLVGSVYHQEGAVFNTMGYIASAESTYQDSQQVYNGTVIDPNYTGFNETYQLVYNGNNAWQVPNQQAPWQKDISGIKAFTIEGDIVQDTRGAIPNEVELDLGEGVELGGLVSENINVNRHSMALEVIRLHAYYNVSSSDWEHSAKYFMSYLYDNYIGELAGAAGITGAMNDENTHDYAGIMRTAIAYSTIDEGTLIFGDTGVRALFDDANDLGKALDQTNVSGLLNATAGMISQTFVQYAGQLAIGEVTQENHAEALDGVLTLSEDSGALTLDFSDAMWGLGRESAQDLILGREFLFDSLRGSVGAAAGFSWDRINSDTNGRWGMSPEGFFNPDFVDKVILATRNTGVEASIDPETDQGSSHVLDEVTYILGGTGNDTLSGSKGSDVIFGGAGDDIIYASTKGDLLQGGSGADSYYLTGTANPSNYDTYIVDSGIADKIYINGIQLAGTIIITPWDDEQIGDGPPPMLNGYLIENIANGEDLIVRTMASRTIIIEDWENGDYGIFMPGWRRPVRGTENDDNVIGDEQDNILHGNGGNDTLTGGEGSDAFYFVQQASAINIITDFDVTDELIDLTDVSLTGIHDISAIAMSDDNGDAILQLGDGHTLRLQGVDYTTLSSTNFSFSPWPNETLYGSEGDDVITTGGGYDRLYGMGGNDTLNAGAAHDALYGDDGSLGAIGGDDILIGGDGYDQLYGEGGNDTLDGGADGDQLYGGAGNDVMTGGAGSDAFYFMQEANAMDTITDFEIGTDYIDLNDISLGAIEDISDLAMSDDNGTAVLQLGNGHILRLEGVDYTALINDNFQFFVNYVTGYNGDETLNGTEYKDYINAYAGNTVLNGFGGNDHLEAQAGDNTLVGGLGDDTLYGGYDNGVDTFAFEKDVGATDTINRFFLANDRIDLSDSSLSYISGLGDLALSDDNGYTVIVLGDGQSIRFWGNYELLTTDHFIFAAGPTIIDGTTGDDTLVGSVIEDSISGGDGNDQLEGKEQNDTLSGGLGNDTLFGDDGDDLSFGDEGDDVLWGWNGADTLHGGTGNDLLGGDAGNDQLNGNDGADSLYGGAGDDVLDGGAGNDTLYNDDGDDSADGGDGDDAIWGWNGNDTLHGGAGNDTLGGDQDDDLLYGDAGNDVLTGGTGHDALYGGADNDTLSGEAGNDLLEGGDGADGLYGHDDADTLIGGAGNDFLDGGAGADILKGGLGTDGLTGGAGADIFVFDNAAESGLWSGDWIYDFASGTDKLDVSAIVTDFDLIGTGAFSGTGGAEWQHYDVGGNTVNHLDIDGDGAADFEIVMAGQITVSESDFI